MINGSPERRNVFCAGCKDEIAQRMVDATADRHDNGICMWCGDAYTNHDDATDHVCDDCKRKRDWVQKCGRFSNTIVRYVTNRAKKWEYHRLMMARKVEESKKPESVAHAVVESDDRLTRLELMMDKLCKSLGV